MRHLLAILLLASPVLAQESQPTTQPVAPEDMERWGAVDPGKGFTVGKTDLGDLRISIYALFRYLNQLPADQTFVDHLGRTHVVDTRNDFQFHRAMVFLDGWMFLKRFTYNVTFWTVNATAQVAIIGALGFEFGKGFRLYAGWNGLPGVRSLGGSHPYWLAHDRVMADEFFRPFFTSGIWAMGEPVPRLFYSAMIGNNNSQLGITAAQLTRDLSGGLSVWWLPTTGEFGPRGGYGDFESHDGVATRFGFSSVLSREDRFGELSNPYPDNTTLRLSDSLNLFETGSLADGVTVQKATFALLSIDAGVKYRGLFLQAEYYNRWLWDFVTDGPVPQSKLHAQGFYVQGSLMVAPKHVEVYSATSQIWGEFNRCWEVLGGANWYFAGNRNLRLNMQLIYAHRSPVSSSFGFYVGGLTGPVVSAAVSVFF